MFITSQKGSEVWREQTLGLDCSETPPPPKKKKATKNGPKRAKKEKKKKRKSTKFCPFRKKKKTQFCGNMSCGAVLGGCPPPRSSTKLPRSFHETPPPPPRSSTKLPRSFHEGQGYTEKGPHKNPRLWGKFRAQMWIFAFFSFFSLFFAENLPNGPQNARQTKKNWQTVKRAIRGKQSYGNVLLPESTVFGTCESYSKQHMGRTRDLTEAFSAPFSQHVFCYCTTVTPSPFSQ